MYDKILIGKTKHNEGAIIFELQE